MRLIRPLERRRTWPTRSLLPVRTLALLGGLCAAAALSAGPVVAQAARRGSTPPSSPEIRAEAIAEPSVVYTAITWDGWVWVPPGNHVNVVSKWYRAPPVTTTCSGFVASSSGYVVTAGHCVDDQSMTNGGKSYLLQAWLAYNVRRGRLTIAQARTLGQDVVSAGRVEGRLNGAPPSRSVTEFQPSAPAGGQAMAPGGGQARVLAASNSLPARVVDYRSLPQGDVALLKVSPPHPIPALQVAAQPPPTGTEIISAGYPGSVAGIVDANRQPSFKTGSVSSRQTVDGVPFIETNADNTGGMSGGPTIDQQGRVVGTVSFAPMGERQAFNFISDTSMLRGLLSRNGVPASLSLADRAYRAGLADYYAGHYHDAVAQFDTVLAAEPGHALAAQFRAKAVASYPNEVTGTSPWTWVGVGVGMLVLVGAGVVVLLTISRRRQTAHWQVLAERRRGPMNYCTNCGAPHSARDRFCASCGQVLTRADSGSRSSQD